MGWNVLFGDMTMGQTTQKVGIALVETALGAVGNSTITAAQTLNGIVTHAPTGANTDTFATGTLIVAEAGSGVPNGASYSFSLYNTSGANALTVAAGVDGTITDTDGTTGSITVGTNASAHFKVVLTDVVAPAVNFYRQA